MCVAVFGDHQFHVVVRMKNISPCLDPNMPRVFVVCVKPHCPSTIPGLWYNFIVVMGVEEIFETVQEGGTLSTMS